MNDYRIGALYVDFWVISIPNMETECMSLLH
jgi:hypothetical protein